MYSISLYFRILSNKTTRYKTSEQNFHIFYVEKWLQEYKKEEEPGYSIQMTVKVYGQLQIHIHT